MEPAIISLINKYLSGEATAEEQAQVEAYYQSLSRGPSYVAGLSTNARQQLEEKLLSGILQRVQPEAKPWWMTYGRVAAALVVLVAVAVVARFYQSGSQKVVLRTGAGQVATFTLPDESKVTLNGNSVLEYTGWSEQQDRQVSLQGEAYFSVTHTKSHQKFIVNVPGKMQVEVLGTEFNVSSRRQAARVVLNSGKVRLRLAEQAKAIEMVPGEMVEVAGKSRSVAKKKVNPLTYSSWSQRMLVLDKTKLSELVQILEDTYGLQVRVGDSSLLAHTFSGRVPQHDVDMLLLGVSKAFDLKVTRQQQQVIIDRQ